jgi:hypothetical protein
MLQSSKNNSKEIGGLEQQIVQQVVKTQQNQVSNILEQPKLNNQIPKEEISEFTHFSQESQDEYIKSLKLEPDFQYDSTIANAGE